MSNRMLVATTVVLSFAGSGWSAEPAKPQKQRVVNPEIQRIEQALNRPIHVDFRQTTLTEVANLLKDQTGVNVVLDRRGLQTAKVSPDAAVSLTIGQVSFKSVLKLILEPLELTYLVQDDVLLITDKAETGTQLVTRAYSLGNLVFVKDQTAEQRKKIGLRITRLIEKSVAKDSWRKSPKDAGGTLEYFAPTASIVVTCTEETHDAVAQFLEALREFQAARGETPKSL